MLHYQSRTQKKWQLDSRLNNLLIVNNRHRGQTAFAKINLSKRTTMAHMTRILTVQDIGFSQYLFSKLLCIIFRTKAYKRRFAIINRGTVIV